jgi:hypothetical protein
MYLLNQSAREQGPAQVRGSVRAQVQGSVRAQVRAQVESPQAVAGAAASR